MADFNDFSDKEVNEWFDKMSGVCLECSKPILKTHIHQKFCSPECTKNWHSKHAALIRKAGKEALEGKS